MSSKRFSKKFKRDVLLLLLEVCRILIDEDFSEMCFCKVTTRWKRFLLDFTEMLVSQWCTLLPQQEALKSLLKSNPRLYRVGSMYRCGSSKFTVGKHVPVLRISGSWLENYDFCVGERFMVYAGKGQLIVKRLDSSCYKSLNLGERPYG